MASLRGAPRCATEMQVQLPARAPTPSQHSLVPQLHLHPPPITSYNTTQHTTTTPTSSKKLTRLRALCSTSSDPLPPPTPTHTPPYPPTNPPKTRPVVSGLLRLLHPHNPTSTPTRAAPHPHPTPTPPTQKLTRPRVLCSTSSITSALVAVTSGSLPISSRACCARRVRVGWDGVGGVGCARCVWARVQVVWG